jgi:hypothetical protein
MVDFFVAASASIYFRFASPSTLLLLRFMFIAVRFDRHAGILNRSFYFGLNVLNLYHLKFSRS